MNTPRTYQRDTSRYRMRDQFYQPHRHRHAPIQLKSLNKNTLYEAFTHLKTEGGPAPGPDGTRYADLSKQDAGRLCRDLERLIRPGKYHPSAAREVRIQKKSGNGYRTLQIRSIAGRVVSKSLAKLMSGHIDCQFLPTSFGYRPRTGPWHMLRTLKDQIELGNPVVAKADIRNAFDNVPVNEAMRAVARFVDDPAVLSLIRTILEGNTRNPRTTGIDQGDPLSPLILNILLHFALDVPSSEMTDHLLLRYADDVVAARTSISEGQEFLTHLSSTLAPLGFTLKETDQPVDLQIVGSQITILGLNVGLNDDNRVVLTIPEEAWNELDDELSCAHGQPNPSRISQDVVKGWIFYHGPAFESNREEVANRLMDSLTCHGFLEIPRDVVWESIVSAHERWLSFIRQGDLTPTVNEAERDAAPPVAADHVGAVMAPTSPSDFPC